VERAEKQSAWARGSTAAMCAMLTMWNVSRSIDARPSPHSFHRYLVVSSWTDYTFEVLRIFLSVHSSFLDTLPKSSCIGLIHSRLTVLCANSHLSVFQPAWKIYVCQLTEKKLKNSGVRHLLVFQFLHGLSHIVSCCLGTGFPVGAKQKGRGDVMSRALPPGGKCLCTRSQVNNNHITPTQSHLLITKAPHSRGQVSPTLL
jgi:hypothetical protein